MTRLCGRPGCSEVGAVAYGMIPEDLLFWVAPIADAPTADPGLLCKRHADAMVVPRGWTLDDRREPVPRLFSTRNLVADPTPPAPRRRRRAQADPGGVEQMQIDGTGEIGRPTDEMLRSVDAERRDRQRADDRDEDRAEDRGDDPDEVAPWQPDFDADDDLDGLLQVSSPLLARAFRGTDRPRR